MSINIEQIKIVVNPSISGSAPVELTSDLIYHPELNVGKKLILEKYPYFTVSLKYPINMLEELNSSSYKKIVKFFFNKKYFESKLIPLFNKNPVSPKNDEEKQSIYNYNIMVMLHFLFSTVFPGVNNVVSSFNSYINTKKDSSLPIFSNKIKGKLSARNMYSYLNLNNNKYTITKVVWLNDILNNPTYNELIDKYLAYKLWIKETETVTKGMVEKNLQKILKRLKNYKKDDKLNDSEKKMLIEERDSLEIKDNIIESFNTNLTKTIEKLNANANANRNVSYQDTETISYKENLDKIIEKLKLLQSGYITLFEEKTDNKDITVKKLIINGIENNNEAINYLVVTITDINEAYNKIKSNSRNTLSGIPSNFQNILNTLTNEIKNLNVLNKIVNVYLNSQTTNLNYEKDDADTVKFLKDKYTKFTDYVDSINKFLPPSKKTSNVSLQDIINKYSINEKDDSFITGKSNKVLLFEEIMEKAKEELMYSNKISYFSKPATSKYLNTGVNIINIGSVNLPTLEIQIAVDVIEGEYNNSNINKVKCKYRSLFLGQETEIVFSNQNKILNDNHKIYLSKEQIEEDSSKKDAEKKEPEKPKKGGKSLKKTQKRRCVTKRNKITRKYYP